MNGKLKKIRTNKYVAKIMTALSGTILSQLLPILFSPLLSRIYPPEAFGVYASFVAASAILATLFSLSFDVAVSVAESREDTVHLLQLVIALSGVMSIVAFAVFLLSNDFFAPYLGLSSAPQALLLLPVYVFFLSIYHAVGYVYIRLNSIKNSAKIKVHMSILVLGFNLLFSVIYTGTLSLVIAQVIAYLGLMLLQLVYLKRLFTSENIHVQRLSLGTARRLFSVYKKFPTNLFWGNTINTLALQLPAIIISSLFGSNVGGYYSMTHRVLALPSSAIGTAFGDVYKNEAFLQKKETGSYYKIYLRSLCILLAIGILPFTVLFLFAPGLFSFVFGPEWRVSGEMAQVLTPMYFLKLLSVPLGFSLIISAKFTQNLIIQATLLLGTLVALYGGAYLFEGWTPAFLIYMLIFSVSYLIVIIYACRLSKQTSPI